jgi:hypothetical protein
MDEAAKSKRLKFWFLGACALYVVWVAFLGYMAAVSSNRPREAVKIIPAERN